MTLVLSKNLKILLKKLLKNPNGQSTIEELCLPFKDENFEIYETDRKIYMITNEQKISYFFMQDKYVSHFELIRRILFLNGIVVKDDGVQSYVLMKNSIEKMLKGEKL